MNKGEGWYCSWRLVMMVAGVQKDYASALFTYKIQSDFQINEYNDLVKYNFKLCKTKLHSCQMMMRSSGRQWCGIKVNLKPIACLPDGVAMAWFLWRGGAANLLTKVICKHFCLPIYLPAAEIIRRLLPTFFSFCCCCLIKVALLIF